MSGFKEIQFAPSNMSAFGTLETNELTPIMQGDFVYGINNQMWTYNYLFTVTTPAVLPAVGDVYTNNNGQFTVIYSVGTTLLCSGTSAPTATGNLVRLTGAGSTPIVYSAFTQPVGVSYGANALVDTNAGRLRIQSGKVTDGYSYLTSRRIIRYRAGQGITFRYTPLFTTGVANNVQYWGAGTVVGNIIQDGYFFGYNGTVFGISHYAKGSLVHFYPQTTEWNGDKVDGSSGSSFTWNPTFGSPVMIKYPYLGYGDIEFFIQHPTLGRWVLVHVIQYANTTATTQLGNPSLQFLGFTLNSGNTATNMIMYCGSVGIFLSGVRDFVGNPKYGIDNNKATITTETNILTLKNCNNYNGVINKGMVRLNSVSFASDGGNGVAILRLKLGITLAGTPVYTPLTSSTADNGASITAGNSIVSYDVAGTTITGGIQIFNTTVARNTSNTFDLTPYHLYIAPGEICAFTAFAGASATIAVTVNWSEDI